MESLKSKIRSVPDFPKAGILFYDITTLLRDRDGFQMTIEALAQPFEAREIDIVVGVESRGFILGGAVADRLGAGFAPVRKKGKLPSKTVQETYDLEYGTDCLEIHSDAVEAGQRVLIIDDVLATGGTAAATTALVRKLGGDGAGACVSRRARVPQRPLEDSERDCLQRPEILRMITLLAAAALAYVLWRIGDELQRQRREATLQQLLATFAPAAAAAQQDPSNARLVSARADEPQTVS